MQFNQGKIEMKQTPLQRCCGQMEWVLYIMYLKNCGFQTWKVVVAVEKFLPPYISRWGGGGGYNPLASPSSRPSPIGMNYKSVLPFTLKLSQPGIQGLKQCLAFAPGRDGFIPGGNHANLCLAWNKSICARRNSPCLNAALIWDGSGLRRTRSHVRNPTAGVQFPIFSFRL